MCGTCSPKPHSKSRSTEIRIAASLVRWSANREIQIYTKWGRSNPDAEPLQCGTLRPDFLWDLEDEQRAVILEVDENAHRSYPVGCEFARPLKLCLGFKKPLYFIRYNPDPLTFVKKMPQAKQREELLLSRLRKALAPAPSDDSYFKYIVTIEFLYYFDIPGSQEIGPYIQTIAFTSIIEYEVWANETINRLQDEKHRQVHRAVAAAGVSVRQ